MGIGDWGLGIGDMTEALRDLQTDRKGERDVIQIPARRAQSPMVMTHSGLQDPERTALISSGMLMTSIRKRETTKTDR